MKQLQIADAFQGINMYDPKSTRCRTITKRLAIFIGATNVSIRLVENEEFRELIHELDKRYKVPSRTKINREIEEVFVDLKANLKLYLKDAKSVNICADIWTKKGLTASFLGITSHFFSLKDGNRHCITLAVRKMSSPHTAVRIAELVKEILEEWDIHETKVHRILTDNGSNMVAAFKISCLANYNKDKEEVEVMQEIPVNEDSDSIDDDSGDDSVIASSLSSDIQEFETCEVLQQTAFTGYKRSSCFAHTLQLVVQVFDQECSSKSLLRSAHRLVNKINRSSKAIEKLITAAGKKLISDCPTRWSSTYLMIARLVELRSNVSKVLVGMIWQTVNGNSLKC